MFDSEEIIRRDVQSPEGDAEFQVRWLADEGVGVLTDRQNHAWFLLDSGESWYDLTQERYPPKQKCRCKNDWFTLTLDFVPRIGTEDLREAAPRLRCSSCGREKRLSSIELDYSPTIHLLAQPLSPCPAPRIKYKTYSRLGYWTSAQLRSMSAFLLARGLLPHCLWFDHGEHCPRLRALKPEELESVLMTRFLSLYFSREPMTDTAVPRHSLWRKQELFELVGPICVVGPSGGLLYEMRFSAEYLDKDGRILPKSPEFSRIVSEFLAFAKKELK